MKVTIAYRTWMKATRLLPENCIKKMRMNVRDGFELYKEETEPSRLKELIRSSHSDALLFKDLLSTNERIRNELLIGNLYNAECNAPEWIEYKESQKQTIEANIKATE